MKTTIRCFSSASRLLMAFVAATLFTLSAQATVTFCAYPSTPCDPNKAGSACYVQPDIDPKCGDKECCKCNKSPNYVGSGVYVTDAIDFSIPTNGFPLVVSRHYRSNHGIDGPVGIGWTSSFHARVHYTTYLYAAPSTYLKEAEVIMPNGDHFRFTDSGNGTFQPPPGRYDRLVRKVDGSFALTLQRSRSVFDFGPDGRLLAMTDDYGNATSLTYDTAGRVQRIEDSSGSNRSIDVYYGADGRISAVEDNTGRRAEYTYGPDGTLASVADALGRVTSYSYSPGRFGPLLSRITDPWGRITHEVAWDATSRVTSYSENGETHTYAYQWMGDALVTAKSDGGGNRWLFPHDEDGLVTETRAPNGNATHTTFYADGSIQLSTDADGTKTYYTYTTDGRVASVTKNYGEIPSVRYDYTYDAVYPYRIAAIKAKNPVSGAAEPDWQGSTYDYYGPSDPAPGALHHSYRLRDDGLTPTLLNTYTYDAHGRVIAVADAAGATTNYGFDAAGNLHTITFPSNNDSGTRGVITQNHDGLGRLIGTVDPLGNEETYTWDAVDRPLTITMPSPTVLSALTYSTSYSYDNVRPDSTVATIVTDANGLVTTDARDQFGRPRQLIDSLGHTTTYTYSRDLLAAVTDSNGNATSFGYDSSKRRISTTYADGAIEANTYTVDGQVLTSTDRRGVVTSYVYDVFGRVVEARFSTRGGLIHFEYDGQKLVRVTDSIATPTEEHVYEYDDLFRVARVVQGARGAISYTRDATDAVTATVMDDGPTTTYSYYADHSLDAISWSPVAGAFKYRYRLDGQYDSIAFPSGQVREFNYDDQGRLTRMANLHPSAGNLATYEYGYDLDNTTGLPNRRGQLMNVTATVPYQGLSGARTEYHYDNRYQLTGAEYPVSHPLAGQVHQWTYDAMGNRVTASDGGAITAYSYQHIGSNPASWRRLATAGNVTYAYDAAGNTTTRADSNQSTSFGWDQRSNLSSIGTSIQYRYDYFGRRASKVVDGITTQFVYDGDDLVAENSTSGDRRYLFGPGVDEPLAASTPDGLFYYVIDGLGSVSLLTDGTGAVTSSYIYDAWGVTVAAVDTIAQPFVFQGRERGETGLLFYRGRYLEPSTGRFLSEDPFRQHRTKEAYRFVRSRPTSYVDPFGTTWWDKTYGFPPTFWNWLHRRYKHKSDLDDLDEDMVHEAHEEWKGLKKPNLKKKKYEQTEPDEDTGDDDESDPADTEKVCVPCEAMMNPPGKKVWILFLAQSAVNGSKVVKFCQQVIEALGDQGGGSACGCSTK